jgi:hypothetical protein
MNEIFPVVAGVVLALLIRPLASARSRLIGMVAGSLTIGAVASYVSGELFESWWFLAIDTALVLISAGLTTVLVLGWERSRSMR